MLGPLVTVATIIAVITFIISSTVLIFYGNVLITPVSHVIPLILLITTWLQVKEGVKPEA